MTITKYHDYRKWIQDTIKSFPRDGYGVQAKLCATCGIYTSYMAAVLKGEKQLTPEQAIAVSDFFKLNMLESDYFVELVLLDRAGSKRLEEYHKGRLQKLKEKLTELKDRSAPEKELKTNDKATFYSDWRYSAIRNACSLKEMTAVRVADALGLPIEVVHRLLVFLLEQGLVKEEKGFLKIGPTFTRVRANDPLVYRHHANWRQRAIESFRDEKSSNTHVTAVVSLAEDDILKIREILYKSVEKSFSLVEDSPSEQLWCVNLDWFRVDR